WSGGLTRTARGYDGWAGPSKGQPVLALALFRVWDAIGRRRGGPADHAGQDHDRDEVGQGRVPERRDRLHERAQIPVGRPDVDDDAEGRGGAEQERPEERTDRSPAPEDHRGKGDEAA